MSERGGVVNKDPQEVRKYTLDWADALDEGDTIGSSDWAFPTGITEGDPDTHDDTSTTVWVAAGSTPGDYTLENTIFTTEGETLQGHLLVRVRA